MNNKDSKTTVFRFKHFSVENRLSAMKVNTDGVLLGAWADVNGCAEIWDVGTGTGLIALMLIQRADCNAMVRAIEIDYDAFAEANENFRKSAWSSRLFAMQGDFVDVVKDIDKCPDLIVSNPPYFSVDAQGLVSGDERRATARHATSLNYLSLIELAARMLSTTGHLCFISPSDVDAEAIKLHGAKCGVYVHEIVEVCTNERKAPSRIMWRFGRELKPVKEWRLSMRSGGEYDEQYKALVKDYYLWI